MPTEFQILRAVRNEVRRRMKAADLGRLLVMFAQRRIDRSGDSTHRYPELWKHPKSIRRGQKPLKDRGKLYRSLIVKTEYRAKQITFRLRARGRFHNIALAHQQGFTTKGPNFVPLMRKAYSHVTGADPLTEGLVRGKHYVVMKNGVTVPQRKIFNWPPEDERTFMRAWKRAMSHA